MLIVGAVLLEFRPTRQVLHPFVAEAVEAGSPPEVVWREVPEGLFPVPELAGAVATHRLAAGEPISESDLSAAALAPSGWWQIALEVSFPMVPGTEARIVLTDSSQPVRAIVVRMSAADSLQGPVAVVAVRGEDAADVAQAVANRRFVVLAETGQ